MKTHEEIAREIVYKYSQAFAEKHGWPEPDIELWDTLRSEVLQPIEYAISTAIAKERERYQTINDSIKLHHDEWMEKAIEAESKLAEAHSNNRALQIRLETAKHYDNLIALEEVREERDRLTIALSELAMKNNQTIMEALAQVSPTRSELESQLAQKERELAELRSTKNGSN